jgi:hypothetical protein
VTRVPACDIQPESDLGARLVTRGVGPLSSAERQEALLAGTARAEALVEAGHIHAAALHLAGDTVTIGHIQGALSHA